MIKCILTFANRSKWEDNTTLDRKVEGVESLDWLHLVHERIYSYKLFETIKGEHIFKQLLDDQSVNKDSAP